MFWTIISFIYFLSCPPGEPFPDKWQIFMIIMFGDICNLLILWGLGIM